MRILSLDPSGNMGDEGMGCTGWAIYNNGDLEDFGDIDSKNFSSQEEYWAEHTALIVTAIPDAIVCESYRLFGHKAKSQSWSKLETPQLIGYLRMFSWTSGIRFEMQSPSDKTRVADPQLVRMGLIEKRGAKYYCKDRLTNLHMRDAIRHGLFYLRYGGGKDGGKRLRNIP